MTFNRRPDLPGVRTVSRRRTEGMALEFTTFLHEHLAGLRAYAAALSGDRDLAHDVLGDALMKAESRWRSIREMDHPKAYVERVITTVFFDHARKEVRRKTDSVAEVPEVRVEGVFEKVEQRLEIASMLATLPPRQLAAVALRYLYDMDDQAIADRMGCGRATARSHVSQALKALRQTATKTSHLHVQECTSQEQP